MSEPEGTKPCYKTTSWAAYNAALKARGSLTIWLERGMQWFAPPSVSCDGAYDTKACHAAIPPRKNARPWKATLTDALTRNEALRACHRLGRSIWQKWSSHHCRSLVETKMHCLKRLCERVMARTFERQVAELHVRVALMNRFTQLGRPTTVAVGAKA